MKISAFLLLVVGCCGVEWKAVNEFKDTFKEYTVALNTISAIENILNTSAVDSERFLNKTFSDNSLWDRLANIRLLSSRFESNDDTCNEKIIDEDKFRLSYQIQVYQIQVPLRMRAVDIGERLNNISSSLDIFSGLAESKYLSCKMLKGKCMEETNEWLESTISSLSCVIYPNCSNHTIVRRSTCSEDEFSCSNGECIASSEYCNGRCDCGGCNDEPQSCVKDCSEFRCNVTFRCVSKNKLCDQVNDCGDWSDEDGCPLDTNPPQYSNINCKIDRGYFLCKNTMCISLGQVCDGYNDCGDWSDENGRCGQQCTPECAKKGGICFTEPKGTRCLYECPPGTYETSNGCSPYPDAPLPSLVQLLEDSPRLVTMYAAKLKYLKLKTIMALSDSLRELIDCKKNEFTLLNKMIDFSAILYDKRLLRDRVHGAAVNIKFTASGTADESKFRTTQPPTTLP